MTSRYICGGNYHQGSLPFSDEFLGSQCTVMSLIAIIISNLVALDAWMPEVVNTVLYHGHFLYRYICIQKHGSQPQFLLHTELPSYLVIVSDLLVLRCKVNVLSEHSRYSLLGSVPSIITQSIQAFESCFMSVLALMPTALITLSDMTFCIMKQSELYYVFDSHSRNGRGEINADGTAVLLQFDSVQSITQHFERIYSSLLGSPIEITPVDIVLEDNSEILNINVFLSMFTTPQIYCEFSDTSTVLGADAVAELPCTLKRKFPESSVKLRVDEVVNSVCESVLSDLDKSRIDDVITSVCESELSIKSPGRPHVIDREKRYSEQSNSAQVGGKRHLIHLSQKNSNVIDQHVISSISEVIEAVSASNFAVQIPFSSNIRKSYDLSSGNKFFRFKTFCDLPLEFVCQCCSCMLYANNTNLLGVANTVTEKLGLIEGSACLCNHCIKKINQNCIPPRSKFNSLYVVPVPTELNRLNIIERRFICKLQTYMTIIVLPAGQQYAQRGLAIHFPFEILEVLNTLPSAGSTSLPVICTSGKTFAFVRPSAVFGALICLQASNPFYADILIDYNANIEFGGGVKEHVELDETGAALTDYDSPSVSIEQLLTTGQIVQFPRSTEVPVNYNEYANAEPMAFPWLFPTGTFHRDSERHVKISLLQYYWSRLYNVDNRFRLDIPYVLTSCNAFERASLLQHIEIQARIFKSASLDSGKYTLLKAGDIQGVTSNSEIVQNSYMFMKKIRGTCAYWKDRLWDLLATIKGLGPPDIFLTLSCDDTWPDLWSALKNDLPRSKSPAEAVRKDPLIVAWHFERRWTFFLKQFINAKDGPFGNVVDYWARIEFQNRGSPHVHAFFWVEDAPSLHRASSQESMCRYIDRIISCAVPKFSEDPEMNIIVGSKHKHCHKSSCQRNRKCRYGFPRRFCAKTRITPNFDISVRNRRYRFYELKRRAGCEMINEYNPSIARAWNANTDCQMVGSYIGAAYYACSYICKAEPEELRQKIASVIDSFQDVENISKRTRLLKIGMTVLKCRQLSAVEACFRVGNLKLTYSSRQVVFIGAGLLQNRTKLLKPRSEWIEASPDSTDIFKSSMIDHYKNRPEELESLSLHQFSSSYRIDYSKRKTSRGNQRVSLLDNKTVMVKRIRRACIRVPHFREGSDDYYYALLLMHIPHRNEDELIQPYTNAADSFLNKFDLIDTSELQGEAVYNELIRSLSRIRMCQMDFSNNFLLKKDFNLLDSNTYAGLDNTQELENALQDTVGQPSLGSDLINYPDEDAWHRTSLGIPNVDLSYSLLTSDQKRVVRYVAEAQKAKKMFQIFITGDAGTGKSFLFRFLVQHQLLTNSSVNGLSSVLVCAPTGIAARNVMGQTIHSALKIPVQHGYESAYHELSARSLQILQKKFSVLRTLFVDEVSMVSAKLLEHIHRRLSAIKQSNEPFGGINVIFAGDFFQLRPVRGKFAFTHTVLWQLFEYFFLDENVRQRSDQDYMCLLKRAKLGCLTEADRCMLKTRLTAPSVEIESTMLHMYPTIKQVANYNQVEQTKLAGEVIGITAETFFASYDLLPGLSAGNEFVPPDDRIAGGLLYCLKLSVGTRVMLLKNICQEEGLVNGAMGYVESIDDLDLSKVIYVKFDDPSVGRMFQSNQHNAIAIEPVITEYIFKGRQLLRRQLPLCPAWAVTIHKSQGLSTVSAKVSLGKEIFCAGQAYVALSRVSTLNGLYIEKLDFNRIYCDESVLENNCIMRARYEALRKAIDQQISSAD